MLLILWVDSCSSNTTVVLHALLSSNSFWSLVVTSTLSVPFRFGILIGRGCENLCDALKTWCRTRRPYAIQPLYNVARNGIEILLSFSLGSMKDSVQLGIVAVWRLVAGRLCTVVTTEVVFGAAGVVLANGSVQSDQDRVEVIVRVNCLFVV